MKEGCQNLDSSMAVSTTLVTFMVRTPLNTRSLDLYGSWDNFALPYPMSRDVRLGRDHWSGCHNFENIICDGDLHGLSPSRRGGLKMGGKYWYYYKLNDEVEMHNPIEPATNECPLLPGQLVNELDVPFAFSRSGRRDESVSSTSSERRTLDPEAKFTNPRPSPTPPRLVRLNTSPNLPFTASGRKIPQLDAPTHLEGSVPPRIFHVPRMPSLDGLLKSRLEKRDPVGQRKPFQLPKADSQIGTTGNYQGIIDWLPSVHSDLPSASSGIEELAFPSQQSQANRPRGALLLRSHSDDVVPLASFAEHRRQHSCSHSRGNTPRRPMVLDQVAELELTHIRQTDQGPLSMMYGPLTGRRITLEALEGRHEAEAKLEKRLPTLPNTPSSVYAATVIDDSPHRKPTSAMMILDSRFSASTIDTTCNLDSMIMDEDQCGHLLDFTPDAIPSSLTAVANSFSFASGPSHNHIATPSETFCQDDNNNNNGMKWLSTMISHTTIESAISTTPTPSYDESESLNGSRFSPAASVRSSGALDHNFQHYSLPEIQTASEITLKRYDNNERALVQDDSHVTSQDRTSLSHSEGMQQLLDELSYLSAMIQH